MTKASALISPIDPQYTGHRDGEQRRRRTREWLRKRERELGFVSDAPAVHRRKNSSNTRPSPEPCSASGFGAHRLLRCFGICRVHEEGQGLIAGIELKASNEVFCRILRPIDLKERASTKQK
jgi:hypothetical protein